MIGYYPINPGGNMADEDTFGPRFFRTHFYEHMREMCDADDRTSVLEVMLTSGQVLDVARIVELKQEYMRAEVYIDSRDCENTYQAYIRYITIFRINVLSAPREERPMGFNNKQFEPEHEQAKEKEPAKASTATKKED
jgi:hypothetical protein